MEHRRRRHILPSIRILFAAFWGCLCIACIAAPILEAHGDRLIAPLFYALFAPVCHQNPARSFAVSGYPLAVCHRCSGIYLGLFLASLIPLELRGVLSSSWRRTLWVFCGVTPLLLDVFLQITGLWTNTSLSRFLTGLVFGAMLSSLTIPAVVEFVEEFLIKNRRLGALRGHS